MPFESDPVPSATAPCSADQPPPAVRALVGLTLVRVVVDDAVTLALRSAEREASVRIDCAGAVRDEHGNAHAFDPDESPRSLAGVLGLLQERVKAATVESDGALCLQLGAALLTARPHDHQVSWAVKTSDDESASCLAEGMVVWR